MSSPRRDLWRRRLLDPADLPGGLICLVPLLLGTFLTTGIRAAEFAIYGICTVAVLPYLAPFAGSTRKSPANAALLLIFVGLGVATLAASQQETSQFVLQAKSLAATAVWASIYVIVFAAARTTTSLVRVTRWIHGTCIAISGSVYLCAVLHLGGISFGEILTFRDGSFRAFGPLGDQVAFILVLPLLVSLVSSRPLSVGVHVGALLLTATRGAFLALTIGVVAYLIVLASRREMTRGAAWAVLSLCVAGLIVISPVSRVLIDRSFTETTDEAYSFRWTAITSGVALVREHPLLGVGFNGFANGRRAVAADWLSAGGAENGLSRAANQYVQTATDAGLFGAAALVLFVGVTVRNAFRAMTSAGANPVLVGTQLWLVAVLLGNQGALWFLSDASSGFFILAVAAVAAKAAALMRTESNVVFA